MGAPMSVRASALSEAIDAQVRGTEQQLARVAYLASEAARRPRRGDAPEERTVKDGVPDAGIVGDVEVGSVGEIAPVGRKPCDGALEERSVVARLVGHVQARVEPERAPA